jgi:hypothetical protein
LFTVGKAALLFTAAVEASIILKANSKKKFSSIVGNWGLPYYCSPI